MAVQKLRKSLEEYEEMVHKIPNVKCSIAFIIPIIVIVSMVIISISVIIMIYYFFYFYLFLCLISFSSPSHLLSSGSEVVTLVQKLRTECQYLSVCKGDVEGRSVLFQYLYYYFLLLLELNIIIVIIILTQT